MAKSVEYLGHQVDQHRIRALPKLSRMQELRSFLGLLNYYGKFVRNLLHPLNQLLKDKQKWEWSKECDQAFQLAKDSASVLTHYDPKLPMTMAADASAYGIGAVVSHTYQ